MKKTAAQIANEVLRKVADMMPGMPTAVPMSKAPDVVTPQINKGNPWDKSAVKPIPQSNYNAARPIPKSPFEQSSPATQDNANPLKRIQNMTPKNQIAKPVPSRPMSPKGQSLNTGESS